MTNVNGAISNLQSQVDNNINDFECFGTNLGDNVVNTIRHKPSGEMYFVGKEIALVLGYEISNTDKAIKNNVDEDMRAAIDNKSAKALLGLMSNLDIDDNSLIDKVSSNMDETTSFREDDANPLIDKDIYKIEVANSRPVVFISEYGLYSLITKSSMPNAVAFQFKVYEILQTIRKTGSYGIPTSSTNELAIIANAMSTIGNNSSELVTINKDIAMFNSDIASVLKSIDKLKADIKLSIHKRLGDLSAVMTNTSCIRTKKAWVSRNWNPLTITFATAICNIVQYIHSQSSEINDRAKITTVNSLEHKLTRLINDCQINSSTNRIDLDNIIGKINGLTTEQELINQRLDDLLMDNIPTLRAEIDMLKENR